MALSLLASASVSGCAIDRIYGVERRATVPLIPEMPCIHQVVAETPGVASVDCQEQPGSTSFGLYVGIERMTGVYNFFYRGPAVLAILQVYAYDDGRSEFRHALTQMHRPPEQSLVDSTRPVMLEVERRLEAACRIDDLAEAMRESCRGVRCAEVVDTSHDR